ncbi:DUF4296 domain-containing protein [Flavobacterium piscis]|uniref:DUF4296 domain-containing protein n=1 Tax=Flavobacterium piscis TaxID=1114874 RepID=A0ABU1Y697_9FLAO|nr:DUF4296 domain-containing protein [Flavobacterium piscis]MDR7209752.1 hypothetical protein [Flavobacterium piscis]
MKKFILIVLVLFLSISCKKDLVKEPKQLIKKEKMIDIMYDLSLLEAIRYQNPASLDSMETSPAKFILQKYKVDSLQFAQSNMYYAADYQNYKDIYDEVGKRLEKNKKIADSLVKIEEKKAAKAKKNKINDTKNDSVKIPVRKINIDSIKRRMQLIKK